MTIPYPAPIVERINQGVPLTSYQHDQIHKNPGVAIAAIIDYLNALGPAGAGIPIGASIKWWTNTLPSSFTWENGAVLNRVAYASLFAVYGTTFNTGGEGPDEFRVPSSVGRYNIGTNPMGGISDGAQPTRALGVKFGAATVSFTPTGTVAVNVTNGAMSGSLTLTNGAMGGSLNVTNGAMSGALDVTQGLTGSVSNGTLATNVLVDIGTLATNVTANNNPLTGDIVINNGAITGAGTIPVDGAVCTPDLMTSGEPGVTAIDCASILTVDAAVIASALQSNVTGNKGTLASDVTLNQGLTGAPGVTQGLTGVISNGTLATNVSVDLGTLSSNVSVGLGTLVSNVSVSLGSLASNVSATGSFTGNAGTITLAPATIACNWIIRYV